MRAEPVASAGSVTRLRADLRQLPTSGGTPKLDVLQSVVTAIVAGIALLALCQRPQSMVAVPVFAFAVFAFAAPRAAALSLVPIGVLVPMIFEAVFPGDWVYVEVTAAVVTMCVVLIACGVGLRSLLGGYRLSVEHALVAALAALVLLGYVIPPVDIAWDTSLRVAGGRHFPGLVVCLAMLAVVMLTKPRPAHLLHAFIWSAVAVALFSFVAGYYSGDRLRTVAYLSTCLAVVEGPAVVACLALARTRRAARWLVPAAVCLACVVASGSRTGTLTVMVGGVFVLVAGRSTFVRVTGVGLVTAVMGIALYFGVGIEELLAPWRNRSGIVSSDVQRWEVLEFSLRLIAEHPLRGVGYGNLVQSIDYVPRYGERSGAHNDYLRIAAESGIPALVVFLVILFRGAWPRREGDAAAVRAVVVSSMVWIATEVLLPHPSWSAYFWVFLACLLAMRACGDDQVAAGRGADPGRSPLTAEPGRPARPTGDHVLAAGVGWRKCDAMLPN